MKIVTIGGGSSYTPELIEGFIKRSDKMNISEFWLVDIDEGSEKLDIIYDLTLRMFKKAGLDTKVFKTLDRLEALVGADFVTTQFRVGQLHARANDERISNQFGQLGQETNGAGGMFKAFRTIPVILDIIRDVERLCPDAFVINFTNPAGIVSEMVNRYTNFKRFIGVCNVPIHMRFDLARDMEIDFNDLEIDFLGLNHMVFGLNVYNQGENITGEAIEASILANTTMKNIGGDPFNDRFLREMGVLICPYHRYFYKYEDMMVEQLKKYQTNKTRAEEVMGYEATLFEKYRDPKLDVKPSELELRGGAHYSDVACDVICSIYNNEGKRHTVNIKNNGHVRNLEFDDTIEITCEMTRNGAIPVESIKYLPRHLKGIYELYKSYELAVCEAAFERSYDKALLAMNLSPFSRSDVVNQKLLDAMFECDTSIKYLSGYKKG